MSASIDGHFDIINFLVHQENIDINEINVISYNIHCFIFNLIKNLISFFFETALEYCVSFNHYECVKLLLEQPNIKVNLQNNRIYILFIRNYLYLFVILLLS